LPVSKHRRIARNSGIRWLLVAGVAIVAIIVALRHGEPVTKLHGTPYVVDGDTLIVAGRKVRLLGLDAPEMDQTCRDGDGQDWACGDAARQGLWDLIGGGAVDCTGNGTDRYGRLLAICRLAGTDMGAELVRRGLAVSRGKYGDEQTSANAESAGIWAGGFDDPADWRRRQEAEPEGYGVLDWILAMFAS